PTARHSDAQEWATSRHATPSLPDALPIYGRRAPCAGRGGGVDFRPFATAKPATMLEQYVKKILTSRVYDVAEETPLQPARQLSEDRKSTRLNSSHVKISYAVFCLKKKRHD